MRDNEGLMRVSVSEQSIKGKVDADDIPSTQTTKILEQLRQRVVWLPPRDIGLQTDLRLTRSTGQQTDSSSTRSVGQQTDFSSSRTSGQQMDNLLSWDNGQELNAGLPENLTEILDEDSELSDKGGSHEPVVDREHDPWQGMVALRRWREEYANRTKPKSSKGLP
ncbi:hypothetical protein F4860DRAFT_491420 [Xylaria cubensis]|nr:hypothetical protein F4860DRAFT_491420 [Xylaria cubensis]